MSVVVKDAHGLKAYYHDCLMSEEDRIDENGEPVNYVYAKLKADKVIAHNKYKRCLGKAKWCESEVYNIMRTPLCDMDEHEGWQHDDEFWQRWYRRWLELAEKFKPNNSTAQ